MKKLISEPFGLVLYEVLALEYEMIFDRLFHTFIWSVGNAEIRLRGRLFLKIDVVYIGAFDDA